MAKSNLVGLILCGGLSTRMGEDKGSKLTGNQQQWSKFIQELFTQQNLDTFVSINPSQKEVYSTFFNEDQLILDTEKNDLNGPLRGILSSHTQLKNKDLFVIACDMINLNHDALKHIIDNYITTESETNIPIINNFLQPLVGIYTNKGLDKMQQLALSGELSNKSMMYVIKTTSCYKIEFDDSKKDMFNNFNSPEDLKK